MTTSATKQRAGLVLAAVLTILSIPLVAPIGLARACGCGAYSPQRGGTATVPAETALVRSAGHGTEDVYLSLSVDSSVRAGALLFPVPDRHATVSAGPRELFGDLARLTAAPAEPGSTDGDGNKAAAPRPSVTVENRQQIGPLDVVTLASGDPAALTAWLQHNGFTAKPALTVAARPYTSAGWAFVAVRLRPEAAGTARLDGQLDPLHLHFASDQIVYPMRLSAMAAEPEQVVVYTLAPSRLTLSTADPGMSQVWAGRVDRAEHPELTAVTTGGTDYLTRFTGTVTPATITDDFHFTPAPEQVPDPFPVSASHPHATAETAAAVVGILAVAVLMAAVVVHQRRRTARTLP